MPSTTTRNKKSSKQKKKKSSATCDLGETSSLQNDNINQDKNETGSYPVESVPTDEKQKHEDADTTLVFQCGTCRAIVGDSFTEFDMDLEGKTVSLRAACSVTTKREVLLSKSGIDAGCTYRKICCTECDKVLGKVYTSTTAPMDCRRTTYTFDLRALSSYQLGNCQTLDGKVLPKSTRIKSQPLPTEVAKEEAKETGFVSQQVFDSLDLHVRSVTEATNHLTAGFKENNETMTELKELVQNSTQTVDKFQNGLQNAQNMLLLWEDRFCRLETCEQQLNDMISIYEHVQQIQNQIRSLNAFVSSKHPENSEDDSSDDSENSEDSNDSDDVPAKRTRASGESHSRKRTKQRRRK